MDSQPQNLSRPTAIIILVVILLVIILGGYFLWQSKNKNTNEVIPVQTSLYKTVTIFVYPNGRIIFSVPANWNAYYNGDPVAVTNLHNLGWQGSTVMSVSTSDRPVTVSDINWTQLDFMLTDGDLLDQQFIDELKKQTDSSVITNISLPDFTGYLSTDVLQGNTPSKDDTGGSIYYLRPKIDSPKWNLIIRKQAKGDENFETAVKKIIETLNYIQN